MTEESFHCGYAALSGLPNVGKSTLFNAMLGQKVSIVTPKPQTTRLAARGILNGPLWQAVLVDTPGFVGQENPLQAGMRESAATTAREADLLLYLACLDVKASATPPPELASFRSKCVLVLTKSDMFKKRDRAEFRAKMEETLKPSATLEVSASRKEGLDELKDHIASRLPVGPALFPLDEVTDQTLRQCAAEIIREKTLFFVQEEVPHGLAVDIEEYQERPDGLHAIRATLYVERESQKGIVIGAGGAMLKKIGTAARLDMEKNFGLKVYLTLWVKVAKNWKKDEAFLKRMGLPVGKTKGEA